MEKITRLHKHKEINKENSGKKKYNPPLLVRHGSFEKLTRGGGGTKEESGGGTPKSKPGTA